jgi:hypothetical protein
MPTPSEILDGLRLAASSAIAIAVAWHVVTLVAALALRIGWRPTRRTAGVVLAAPIASVSVVAFAHGNPFNGVLLGIVALSLVAIAWRLGTETVRRSGMVATATGIGMIAFGWAYPHFLESHSPITYLFAAPLGVVPCPSLAVVVGFTLLSGGLRSRGWSLVLAIAGLFYGLFGLVRLGVRLDVGLVAGSAALLVQALGKWSERPRDLAGARLARQ